MKKQLMKVKKGWQRYSWGDRIFLAVIYSVLILVTLICLYPLYFTVIASFSDAYAVYRGEVKLWPVDFTTEAYTLVFQNKAIWTGYANTIFYTVFGTILNLFLTIPAAYALSKKRMWGRDLLMTVFLITMYFGGGMIPTYILMNNLGLINTRWILVICGGLQKHFVKGVMVGSVKG